MTCRITTRAAPLLLGLAAIWPAAGEAAVAQAGKQGPSARGARERLAQTLGSLGIAPEEDAVAVTLDAREQAYVVEAEARASNDGSAEYGLSLMVSEPVLRVKRRDAAFGITLSAQGLEYGPAEERSGMVIYPTRRGDVWAVYRPGRERVKEDVVVESPEALRESAMTWRLDLPRELEARPLPDGSVGIYGPDQYLWGDVGIGDAESAELIERARRSAAKTHLLYRIPAPVIVDAGGDHHERLARFVLEGPWLRIRLAPAVSELDYPIAIDPTVVITLTADFQTGNNEGMLTVGTDQIARGAAATGAVGSWTTNGIDLPVTMSQHAAVVYDGYIYLIGGTSANFGVRRAQINADGSVGVYSTTLLALNAYGVAATVYDGYLYESGGTQTGSEYYADVRYAKFNSGGTFDASWTSATSLPLGRYDHTMVAYDGYMYVIGGRNSGADAYIKTVHYAAIKADGSLGAWTLTTALPYGWGWSSHASVVYNGHLYLIGGDTSGGVRAEVFYAKINPGGAIGNWMATTSVTYARFEHAAVVYSGRVFVLGGDGKKDVYSAPVYANGALGSWSSLPDLPAVTEWRRHPAVAYNGYIYTPGGNDNGDKSKTYYAKTLGGLGTWTGASSFTNARLAHSSLAYSGYLYVIGGLNGSTYYNDVQYALINADGSLGAWTTNATSFATGRYQHTAAAYNGTMYVIGGAISGGTGETNDVQYAPINADGSVGAWNTTTVLPANRNAHATVVFNGRLYVIGGRSLGSWTNDVLYITMNANGTLGASWTLNAASFTTGRQLHASLVYGGFLYVIGGHDGFAYLNDTQYAPINPDGSVGAWSTNATTFTTERYTTQMAVAANGILYVIAGQRSGGYLQDVQYAPINAGGSVGAWATTTQLPSLHAQHAAVECGGYLYVTGGFGGSYHNDVHYAPLVGIAGQGAAGAWTATTSFPTARSGHASVAYRGYLYVLGGHDVTTPLLNDVRYAPINADGTVGSWVLNATSFSTARYYHTAVANNGYLYVIGGYDLASGLNDTQYAAVNSDGSVGAWTTNATSFSPGRWAHDSVAYKGYLYVVGGYNGTTELAEVAYAPFNSNGSVGTWATTTPFNTARSNLRSVAYNGYLYVLGGWNGTSVLGDVQYAAIGSSGTVGAWAVTTPMVPPRYSHTAVAYNGFLYVLGGWDGAARRNDTQYARIQSGGTIGDWTPTSAFTTARWLHSSAAYNGRLYLLGGSAQDAPTNGTPQSDVQYAALVAPAFKGIWSRLVDLGSDQPVISILINGSAANKGDVRLQYRLAPAATAVFGAETVVESVSLGSAVNVGSTARYVWIRVTLDDTYAATDNGIGVGARDVLDITISYGNTDPTAPTALTVTELNSPNPKFQAQFNDPGDSTDRYEIEVTTSSGSYSPPALWDPADEEINPAIASGSMAPSSAVAYAGSTDLVWDKTYYWRIRFRDAGLVWSPWAEGTFALNLPSGQWALNGDASNQRWTLVSVPTGLNIGTSEVSGFSGTWYRWDAATAAYVVTTTLEPGKGYFIKTNLATLGLAGGPSATATAIDTDMGPITLSYSGGGWAGWHILGNPYHGTLNWDTVARVNVDLTYYVYDDGKVPAHLASGKHYDYWQVGAEPDFGGMAAYWQAVTGQPGWTANNIPKFRGFWVHVSNPPGTGGTVTLDAPASWGKPVAPVAFNDTYWRLRIDVRAGEREANHRYAAVHPEASDGSDPYDVLDRNEAEDDYVLTYFLVDGQRCVQDMRTPAEGAWELTVETNKAPCEVEVTFPNAGELPAGWEWRLVDGEEALEMRAEPGTTYRYVQDEAVHVLRLQATQTAATADPPEVTAPGGGGGAGCQARGGAESVALAGLLAMSACWALRMALRQQGS